MTKRSAHALRRAIPLGVLLALAIMLIVAPAALAGPPDPTWDLDELAAALSASGGTMTGHMVTTMSGSTPEDLSLTVTGIVHYSDGALILFESDDPKITDIGGIAAGMSGSPLYVDDGVGGHRLVGAVSYGDILTLDGMGLATPIEYMTAIQDDYQVGALSSITSPRTPKLGTTCRLDSPVKTSSGVIRKIVVTGVKSAASLKASADTAVMVPLGIIEIGGARPGSKAFKRVSAKFADTGMLIKAASGDGMGVGATTPALTGGSPCAILLAQGAVWVGAAGTVTYVDGDAVLMFGHPFDQFGAMEAVLTGGTVDGVWKSSYEPYKLITPTDVKGACVQDRYWGVAGDLSRTAEMIPVSTTVNVGGVTQVTDTSYVSEWLVTDYVYPSMPGSIVGEICYRVLDQYEYPGTATTTTTVNVADGTGAYKVERAGNLWSNRSDVSYYQPGSDMRSMMSRLVNDPDGVLDVDIVDASVVVEFSPTPLTARIASVSLPNGFKVGDNKVVISYYGYGSAELQTEDCVLTIPKKTNLYGRLEVMPSSWDGWGYCCCCCCCCCCGCSSTGDAAAPRTLADIVDSLKYSPLNQELVVRYLPRGGSDSDGDGEEEDISTSFSTGYIFNNYYSNYTARVEVKAQPAKVAYNGMVNVIGWVDSSKDTTVDLYRKDAGSDTETVIKKNVPAEADEGMAYFAYVVPSVKHNTTIIVHADKVEGLLPGTGTDTVKVKAKVWLTGSRKLVVNVRPSDADGKATLQRKSGGSWVNFKKVTVKDGSGSVKLAKGSYVLRAKFAGSNVCLANTSKPYTVTVK